MNTGLFVTHFDLRSSTETEDLGSILWHSLPKKCLVFLNGNLGAGKTTLVRGLLRTAGYKYIVKSPTYSLVEEYEIADRIVFHFDLYRLKDPAELEWLGADDYFMQEALCLVEWPEKAKSVLPLADVEINFTYRDDSRSIEMTSSFPIKNIFIT